jgi:hypothetical protein
MSTHKSLPVSQIHRIHNWEVADNTARDAIPVTADDIGKVSFVTGDSKFYALSDNSPMTWAELGGSGSGSGDVVGPASAVSGNVAVFDGATGKLIKDSGLAVSGSNTGDVTLGSTVADIFSISSQALSADDPGADRLVFWDDSDGKLTHLTAGSGLSISGTTISATSSGITLETPKNSTAGSNVDFTGIPAGTKRITLFLNGVSTNSSSNILIQIGDSGGIENTGYFSGYLGITITPATGAGTTTTGFLACTMASTRLLYGSAILSLMDSANNTWSCQGFIAADDVTDAMYAFGGIKSLSATLDRIRLTTAGGDTFDAGVVNISYE